MTQASVNISQQFKDGGVVPAKLAGQDSASKTYVDEQLAIRDTNIAAAAGAASAAQADIDQHEASTAAHPAQHITYSGDVTGASNVKQGLDKVYQRVNQIIAGGDSSAEVVDARGSYPVLGDRLNASDAQLADLIPLEQNFNLFANWLMQGLVNGSISKIKTIGDSITVGLSTVGAGEDPDGRILIDQGGVIKREPYKTPPGWANLFRKYVEQEFPSVDFINAGIGGWSTSVEGVTYRDQWIGTDNDVVFVMLGTNDRWRVANEDEFEGYLTDFLVQVKANSNYMFVFSPPPTLNDFDASGNKAEGQNITMDQIDRVITKVCAERRWPHLSFYRDILRYAADQQIPLNLLLQDTGGSHPVSAGHMLMWKILQQKLGANQNTYIYNNEIIDMGFMKVKYERITNKSSSSPITDFPARTITYGHIANSVAVERGMPEGLGGTLITHRTDADVDLYSHQEYHIIYSNKIYRRYQQSGGAGWSTWVKVSAV